MKVTPKLKAILKGYILRKIIMKHLSVRTLIKEISGIRLKIKEGANKFIAGQLKK